MKSPLLAETETSRVFLVPKERLAVTVFAGDYNNFCGYSESLFAAAMTARCPALFRVGLVTNANLKVQDEQGR